MLDTKQKWVCEVLLAQPWEAKASGTFGSSLVPNLMPSWKFGKGMGKTDRDSYRPEGVYQTVLWWQLSFLPSSQLLDDLGSWKRMRCMATMLWLVVFKAMPDIDGHCSESIPRSCNHTTTNVQKNKSSNLSTVKVVLPPSWIPELGGGGQKSDSYSWIMLTIEMKSSQAVLDPCRYILCHKSKCSFFGFLFMIQVLFQFHCSERIFPRWADIHLEMFKLLNKECKWIWGLFNKLGSFALSSIRFP